jgi:chemotaxis response regulator CheB
MTTSSANNICHGLIVLGCSAGGFETLPPLLAALPVDLRAALLIVQHLTAATQEFAMQLLAESSKLPLVTVSHGDRITRGRAFLCPSDQHVVVERGILHLDRGPKECAARPSIDVAFRSAASAYGRRVIGVILSGMTADGSAGLWQIKKRGGIAIAQDPDDALWPAMPRSAIASVAIDYCLPLSQIGPKLVALTSEVFAPRPSRVLIAEDERLVAVGLEEELVELGYVIVGCVASGADAVALATREVPDVVLMDIRLCGPVDGTEAARQIWERLQIPIVYMTAYQDERTLEEVKTSEPYGYVGKPIRMAEVNAAIQLALDRREREMRQG